MLKPGSIPIPTGSATVPAPGNPVPNVYTSLGTTTNASDSAATNAFDLSQITNLTLDQTRLSFIGSADRQLFGNHLVAFGDFLYSSNYSQSYLNAQPLYNGSGVVIPAGSPYNPFAGTIDDSNAAAILVSNRFVNYPRIFRQDANFYRVVAGLKGEIIPNYNYEIALNTSHEALTYKNFNLIDGVELNESIAGGYDARGNPVAGGAYSKVDGHLQPALDFFSRSPSGASHGVPSIPNGVAQINADGTYNLIANLSAYYATHPMANPSTDDFEPDGVPYSMIAYNGGLYVIEPNRGSFDKINLNGRITRVLDTSAIFGTVYVPTVLIQHKDHFYLGNLGSFQPGGANVLRVDRQGNASMLYSGFTDILGIEVDSFGRFYVLETSTGDQGPTPMTGDIIRIEPNGRQKVIASGLFFPTGMTLGPDGALYVSNVGFGPLPNGLGQILKVTLP